MSVVKAIMMYAIPWMAYIGLPGSICQNCGVPGFDPCATCPLNPEAEPETEPGTEPGTEPEEPEEPETEFEAEVFWR